MRKARPIPWGDVRPTAPMALAIVGLRQAAKLLDRLNDENHARILLGEARFIEQLAEHLHRENEMRTHGLLPAMKFTLRGRKRGAVDPY